VLQRFGLGRKAERAQVLTARLIAVAIGVIVVLLSSLIQYVPGNVMGVVNKTANLLVAPIFGLFFFALFVPFAKPVGVWVATICSLTTAVLVAFSGPIFGYRDPETKLDPVSFQWIMPTALVVTIVVGTAISWLLSRREIKTD
jgi:Na+/proline symporter